MSTLIKFDLKELRKLANNKNSCVLEKRVTQNIALPPWSLGNLKDSIKNQLSYKIGKFDKEFNGILLSYKNLRILQNVGTIKNDNTDVHFQVQADYYIFRPFVGAKLQGIVNKKCLTHLGVLVHKVFNVVIPRPTEEPGNKWIGVTVNEGQEVIFRIIVLDLFGALPYIRGELDDRFLKQDWEEDDIIESKSVEPINVTHVNLDRAKLGSRKQMGDGFQNEPMRPENNKTSARKNKSPVKSTKKQTLTDTKSSSDKDEFEDHEVIVNSKYKLKRQNRLSNEFTSKQPKKK